MRQRVAELKEVIELVYEVKYCGRSLEETAKGYVMRQREKKEKIREHIRNVREAA